MARKVLFVETAAHGDRHFGHPSLRRKIESAIAAAGRAITSRYVREEFRSTFLASAVLAYNVLLDSERIEDALSALERYRWGSFAGSPRMRGRARQVVYQVLRHGDRDVVEALQTLERWISFELIQWFERGLEVVDETGCCRTGTNAAKDAQGVFRFEVACLLMPRRPCRIEEFWSAGRGPDLKAIAGARFSARKELQNARSAAAEVLAGKAPRGRRCWAKLSDATIAAEAPRGMKILTSNTADFGPLCLALRGGRTPLTY